VKQNSKKLTASINIEMLLNNYIVYSQQSKMVKWFYSEAAQNQNFIKNNN